MKMIGLNVKWPSRMGRNSLKVMCWIWAPTMRLASWYIRSSSHCGLISSSADAIRLCSRAQTVCIAANWGCSLTRLSPIGYTIHLGLIQLNWLILSFIYSIFAGDLVWIQFFFIFLVTNVFIKYVDQTII